MALNYQKWLTVMQIIMDFEHMRRDIINNTAYAQLALGVKPLNEIINVHLKQNANAYDARLKRIKALYDDVGRKSALDDALQLMGFSLAEGVQTYQALRAATDLILDTAIATEADVNSVADEILLPAGAAYLEPHDSLWG
jgi:hypothetical protein